MQQPHTIRSMMCHIKKLTLFPNSELLLSRIIVIECFCFVSECLSVQYNTIQYKSSLALFYNNTCTELKDANQAQPKQVADCEMTTGLHITATHKSELHAHGTGVLWNMMS